MRTSHFLILGFIALSTAGRADEQPAGPAVGEPLRVGFAVADITPPVGWRLAGGYTEDVSTGTHDPLLAKAVVLTQGDRKVALVICDLTGVPRDLTTPLRRLASERTGIPPEAIIIGATHTHCAPLFYDYRRDLLHARAVAQSGRDAHEPIDYRRFLTERIVDAVGRAMAGARPARLRQAVARREGLAFNRRFHMKDGSVRFNPGKRNPDIVRPAGPIDPDLHILMVDDAATGRPVGALSVFAMHVACFGGREFGADFPMHLQARLHHSFGPDFVSVFGEGAAGDVNHIDVSSGRPQTSRDEPLRIGQALADTVLDAQRRAVPVDRPALAVRAETVRVPLRPAGDEQVARARDLLDSKGPKQPAFLDIVEAHRLIDVHDARREGPDLSMDVRAIQIDAETAIVTLPHEVFVELGLAIKTASPYRNTFVVCLCDGIDFYVPTRKAYAEGSYEVVNSRVAPGAGERLVESAIALLKGLRDSSRAHR